jgi:xylulose-5-phosphate/fructose-6-phosphate phosphoketolase
VAAAASTPIHLFRHYLKDSKAYSMTTSFLTAQLLSKMDAYWRAANYLSVGQIYLYENPLLRKPLELAHVKPLVVGHWGTTPGQNFIYVHLNRVISEYDLDMFYVAGPGHGGPALVANTYLEGSYSEVYPDISTDEEGMRRLFKQFSFPGGISSHVAPTTPGSIHEGGELGYSLSHAFGAAFDNPGLIVACVVGDGEAETGPLATAWHSNKFLNPVTDGAVLPILHLNGYKISNPTVLARIEPDELEQFLRGCGWDPRFVEGDDPEVMHQLMAATLDEVVADIGRIQKAARDGSDTARPRWPMIVLRSPKGWTGPKVVDGLPIEGTFRAHQVPLLVDSEHPDHVVQLEAWMHSYRPEELFDDEGRLIAELADLAPKGERRMGANPHTNGGLLLRDLRMPDFHDHAVAVPAPGAVDGQDTAVLGEFLRDVAKLNVEQRNFRVFGPDETLSNLLGAVFEVTDRQWEARTVPGDEFLSADGRVLDSMLSEHQSEGWLEGYLLTGRHGLFNCYEAFIHIVDSMFNQHAKWLKVTAALPWRRKIASLNYLLASHVWQQDHNGFTHQDPGFLDHVVNKKADIVRVYLPPDANCLLSVFDHCLRSRHYVNVVVAGKHSMPQWLDMDAAVVHCTEGIGIWEWASNDHGTDPDVVLACCGDTPTLEILAATSILREHLPELKIRVINVVDLMKLQSSSEHPHGLSDTDYDSLFTKDKHIIFAFHGYPWLIHRLTYRRANRNLHVRGYKEEGTITTAFDMRVQNDLDRFHLVQDVVDRIPGLGSEGAYLKQLMVDKLVEHNIYIDLHGQDLAEIRDWKWSAPKMTGPTRTGPDLGTTARALVAGDKGPVGHGREQPDL